MADYPYAILTAPKRLFSANIMALEPETILWDWVMGMLVVYKFGVEGRREVLEGLRLELRM